MKPGKWEPPLEKIHIMTSLFNKDVKMSHHKYMGHSIETYFSPLILTYLVKQIYQKDIKPSSINIYFDYKSDTFIVQVNGKYRIQIGTKYFTTILSEKGIGKRFHNIVDYTFGKQKATELKSFIGSIDWSDDWKQTATYAFLPFTDFTEESNESNYDSMGEKYMMDFTNALSGKGSDSGAFECIAHPSKITKDFHIILKNKINHDISFDYFKKTS